MKEIAGEDLVQGNIEGDQDREVLIVKIDEEAVQGKLPLDLIY